MIKSGDRLPSLSATLEDANGVVDLTAATVQFRLATSVATPDGCGGETYAPGSVVFTSAAVVLDPVGGTVRYDWGSNDTATPGFYLGEFVATFSGKSWSFPTTGFIPVSILRSLT